MPQVAIVANRAPFSLTSSAAGPQVRRAAGGLVNTFDPLRGRKDVSWFAVAMSDAEREAAREGPVTEQGFETRFIAVEPEAYNHAYNEVYNGTLWPMCHGMVGWASRRSADPSWNDLWEGYRTYNRQVGEAIAADIPDGAIVLAQDLYFALLTSSSTLFDGNAFKSVLFAHLPFASPKELAVLPASAAREMLSSMGRFDAVGFQVQRWRRDFIRCCRSLGVESPRTFVAPAAPPMSRLKTESASSACDGELAHLESILDGRQMLAQLDRMEPVKNIHGSLQAFGIMLARHADIRGKVIFIVLAQPTRQDLADYRDYAVHVRRLCRAINEKHGSPSWQPVHLNEGFLHFLHLAALRRYDVLLVNSIRDGMNLIAIEGPQLNERDGASIISPEVGAFEHQRGWVWQSNPHNAAVTAEAMYNALTVDSTRRLQLFMGLRTAVAAASKDNEFVSRQIRAAIGRSGF